MTQEPISPQERGGVRKRTKNERESLRKRKMKENESESEFEERELKTLKNNMLL